MCESFIWVLEIRSVFFWFQYLKLEGDRCGVKTLQNHLQITLKWTIYIVLSTDYFLIIIFLVMISSSVCIFKI